MPKKWYTLICTKCQGRGHTAGYCWAEVTTEPPPLTIAGAGTSPTSESSGPPILPPRPMPISTWTPSGDKAWDEVDPERLLSLPRWGKTPVIKATVSPKRPRRPKKETKTEAQVTDPNSVIDSGQYFFCGGFYLLCQCVFSVLVCN